MAISPMTRAGPPGGVRHLVFVRVTRVLLYLLRISIKAKQNLFIPHWRGGSWISSPTSGTSTSASKAHRIASQR